jgi:hypothetical protein
MNEIKSTDIDDEIIEQIFIELKNMKDQCARNRVVTELTQELIAELRSEVQAIKLQLKSTSQIKENNNE